MNDLSPISVVGMRTTAKRTAIPPEIKVLLGPSPTVWGESEKNYRQSFLCLVDSLKPQDAIDYMMVKDIAVANWEAQRMTGYIAALVKRGLPSAARTSLGTVMSELYRTPRILGDATREEKLAERKALEAIIATRSGRKNLKSFVKYNDWTETEVVAHSYADQLHIISKLEDNKSRSEDRKQRLLRDYERRQIARGRPGSRIGKDVTDLPADSVI